MLKITTKWKRQINGKQDEQVTPQHFIDVAHYREYEAVMQKRGFQAELMEVLDLDNNTTAKIEGSKIIFGAN
jgi:hypothetical protein